MTEHYTCTYCGDALAPLADAGPGDELHCEDCGVRYDLVDEADQHDLVVVICPYCEYPNKRSQDVDTVRCENNEDLDDREHPGDLDVDVTAFDGDCGLEFDPLGGDTRAVGSDETRVKMVPDWGDA